MSSGARVYSSSLLASSKYASMISPSMTSLAKFASSPSFVAGMTSTFPPTPPPPTPSTSKLCPLGIVAMTRTFFVPAVTDSIIAEMGGYVISAPVDDATIPILVTSVSSRSRSWSWTFASSPVPSFITKASRNLPSRSHLRQAISYASSTLRTSLVLFSNFPGEIVMTANRSSPIRPFPNNCSLCSDDIRSRFFVVFFLGMIVVARTRHYPTTSSLDRFIFSKNDSVLDLSSSSSSVAAARRANLLTFSFSFHPLFALLLLFLLSSRRRSLCRRTHGPTLFRARRNG